MGVGARLRPAVRALLSGGHVALLRLLNTGLTLVFAILATRWLGAEIFGAYVSLMAVAGVIQVATSLGLPALVTREVAARRGDGGRGALPPLVQAVLLINGLLVLGGIVATLAFGATAGLVMLFALLANLAGVLGAVHGGREAILLAGWLGGVVRFLVALAALAILVATTAPSIVVPLGAQIVGALAGAAALALAMPPRRLGLAAIEGIGAPWWSAAHGPMVRAGFTFAGVQLLLNLTTQVDILVLMLLATPRDVALYYAAARAALVVSFFFNAAALLAEPRLTRLHAAGDIAAAQALARQTARMGVAMTLVSVVAAALLGPFYLGLYGEGFGAAYPALVVAGVGYLGWSLFGPAQQVLRAVRAERALLVATAVALAVNAVLTAALVPFLGILGAALGTAASFLVNGALTARAARRAGIATPVWGG
ncbi:lipopolysaccharide biosynthesis protein [Acuticoccus mangrovi]|uniref:Lipopolysaccharide biosynthesis protein n=1 Tax=Acuticoccus mangrovi TaxID=2796142 RepID=A0A934ML05_9HYPH|nr:lipopolysaccharide biosynthesis protein [Acuticoccus mangrovi]MBJ3775919.1 lipopolysaccharide biosynthesis protein [Acuticoccus mangrovi]